MSYDIFLDSFVRNGWGIYFAILLCGFLFGLIKRKDLSKAATGVWLIIGASLFMELAGRMLVFLINTNAPTQHGVYILHFIAFGYTFSKYVIDQRTARAMMISGMVLASLSIFNSLFVEDITAFSTNAAVVFSLFVVIASLFTFLDMLKHPDKIPLSRKGLFWFNTATLIFYATTFFRSALNNYYLENYYEPSGTFMPDWVINLNKGLNYYLYISYSIAIWLDLKKQKENP